MIFDEVIYTNTIFHDDKFSKDCEIMSVTYILVTDYFRCYLRGSEKMQRKSKRRRKRHHAGLDSGDSENQIRA